VNKLIGDKKELHSTMFPEFCGNTVTDGKADFYAFYQASLVPFEPLCIMTSYLHGWRRIKLTAIL